MQRKISDNLSTTVEHARDGEAPSQHLVPALTIVSHPQLGRVGERLLLDALISGKVAPLSRNAPDFSRPGCGLTQSLGDPFLSRTPIQFEPGPRGSLRLRVPENGTRVRVADEPVVGGRELSLQELTAGVPLVLAERVVLLLHLSHTPEAPAA
ncbi:sigma-54-dependent Fis family transcriptional regulator, partial [Pyxidicoccus sp. 3LG]